MVKHIILNVSYFILRYQRSIKHFTLDVLENKFILQNQIFESAKDLIDFYKIHDVPNEEGLRHIRLLHPIPNKNRPRGISLDASSMSVAGSSGGKNFTSRSQSVITAPTTNLLVTAQRHSVDANMGSCLANGTANGSPNRLSNGGGAMALPSPSPSPNDPQLPLNQPKKKGNKFSFPKFGRKSSSGSDVKSSPSSPERGFERCFERGPAPPPPQLPDPDIDDPNYSVIKDSDKDQSGELIYHLAKFESPDDDRCECGLTVEESELPDGWTMHISHEEQSFGKVFFMGPNSETEWQLPMSVTLNLSADQQENIRNVMFNSSHRARSRNVSTSSGGSGNMSFGGQGMRTSNSGQQSSPVSRASNSANVLRTSNPGQVAMGNDSGQVIRASNMGQQFVRASNVGQQPNMASLVLMGNETGQRRSGELMSGDLRDGEMRSIDMGSNIRTGHRQPTEHECSSGSGQDNVFPALL